MTEAQYPDGGPNFRDRTPMLAPKRTRSALGRFAQFVPLVGPSFSDFLDDRKTRKKHTESILRARDPEEYRRRQRRNVITKCSILGGAMGLVFGSLDGAARATFDAGSVTGGTNPSEVQLRDTRMTNKVVIAEADMNVTAAESYKAAPFGEFAEKNLGLFYNRKLACNEVPVTVQYFIKGQDFQYAFDKNAPLQRQGGSPDRPAIKAEQKMGEVGTTVVRTPDIRNNSCTPMSDGLFAPLAGVLSKYAEQEAVKKVIDSVPGSTRDPAPEAQLDNLLRGVMDAHINQLAGEACMTAGKEYNFMQPAIKKLLMNAYVQAILDDFRKHFEDLPQPRAEDVQVMITDKKPQLGDGYEVSGGIGEADKDAINDLVAKPREFELEVLAAKFRITISLLPTEKQQVVCNVAPGAADGANAVPSAQSTEKGKR